MSALSLQLLSGGRFLLGLGVSGPQGFGGDVRAVQELWLSGRRDAAAARVLAELGLATNLLGPGPVPRAPVTQA
jgi:alkanesulfonate monooxygenase SsuD/methylene tetrahydromethanopterin reductase-like flavin-dependent oxidoreductase (luciferase family)